MRGVAYDSIRREPLRDAFVSLAGGHSTTRSTTTDSKGRFLFDSVPPGDYTVAVQHAALDSLGLSGVSRRATVAGSEDEVLLGVPSFGTLWSIECAGLKLPKDSGFVFGTIRDASSGRPVAHAHVALDWTELMVKKGRVAGRHWRSEVSADDHGNYSVCDVPTWEALYIHATADSSTSGEVELAPRTARVERRDLMLGPSDSSASRTGMLSGIVTTVDGQPFHDARVAVADLHEVRTDADGRFLIRDVPLGSQQIEVRSVGVAPISTIIDVMPRDTAFVSMRFGRAITVDGMRVTARPGVRVMAQEFQVRRQSGLAYTLDSTAIAKYSNFVNVFNDIAGIRMSRRPGHVDFTLTSDKGRPCSPTILLDGIDATGNNLSDLLPDEVAGVEVYAHQLSVPTELLPPGRPNECGMVVVWTKYAFRNR